MNHELTLENLFQWMFLKNKFWLSRGAVTPSSCYLWIESRSGGKMKIPTLRLKSIKCYRSNFPHQSLYLFALYTYIHWANRKKLYLKWPNKLSRFHFQGVGHHPYNMHWMHYAEVDKLGSKWSTLTNHFSTDFCTELSELRI